MTSYYVFFGKVGQCSDPVIAGKPVSFTVEIDFDSEVTVTPNYRSFHAAYVSGPGFENKYNIPDRIGNKHGYDITPADAYGARGSLFCAPNVGSDYGDAPLVILSTTKIVSEWVVGDTLWGHQFGGALNPDIQFDLKLICVYSSPLSPPTGLHVSDKG